MPRSTSAARKHSASSVLRISPLNSTVKALRLASATTTRAGPERVGLAGPGLKGARGITLGKEKKTMPT